MCAHSDYEEVSLHEGVVTYYTAVQFCAEAGLHLARVTSVAVTEAIAILIDGR